MFKNITKKIVALMLILGAVTSLLNANVPNAPGPYIGVTLLTPTSVNINFLDNSNNEKGFILIVNGNPIPLPHKDDNIYYHKLENLTCDERITLEVVAYNDDGNSSLIGPRAFNLKSTFGVECSVEVPNAPGSYIGVFPIDETSVRINFLDHSDNETGFRVFGDGINELIDANDENVNSQVYKNIENLICDKVYSIQAVAYNNNGDSLPSDKRDFNIHTTFTGFPCSEGNNSKPIANAGINQTIVEGNMLQLDGSASSDIDADSLTYLWSFISKPVGSVATLSDATLVNPTFMADINGTYILGLVVNDGHMNSMQDTMEVVVRKDVIIPSPKAPIANAGDDVTVTEGVQVDFNGSASYDSDGTILSYEWSENGTLLANTVHFSLNNLAVGTHNIDLTVMDDDGLMDTDTIQVIIKKLTNQGVSFHTAFMNNNGGNSTLSFFISAVEDTDGNITLSDNNETIPFSILAGDIEEIVIPNRMILFGTGIANKVVKIVAEKDIVVVGLNKKRATTDAYLVLPDKILANEYYTMTYAGTNGFEEFAVVALENNTIVNVHLANNLGDVNVTLAKGEVYQYQNRSGLTGTHVQTNNKVALLSGNSCTNIPSSKFYCDHIVEQMLPMNTWENEFITVALKTRLNGDTFRILASEDNTNITINGVRSTTLNKGEYYETILENSNHIVANHPIQVAQYSNSSTYDNITSDPFMALVPALNQFDTEHIINTLNGFTNYVNIVVPTVAINDVELDGVNINTSEFSVVAGTNYSSAQIQISTGKHTLVSSEKMGILGYGYASYDSYGYPSSLRLITH